MSDPLKFLPTNRKSGFEGHRSDAVEGQVCGALLLLMRLTPTRYTANALIGGFNSQALPSRGKFTLILASSRSGRSGCPACRHSGISKPIVE